MTAREVPPRRRACPAVDEFAVECCVEGALPLGRLTLRERELAVAPLAARGWSAPRIARRVRGSVGSVSAALARLAEAEARVPAAARESAPADAR